MSLFKQLLRRKDTRVEAIAVAAVFLVIVVLSLSSRKPRLFPVGPPLATVPLTAVQAGSWTLTLIQLEECPERKIVVAAVRVHGPALSDSGSPVGNVRVPGLVLDGGTWSGTASVPIAVPYAGACGGEERCTLSAGEGLIVLRLRGTPAARPLPLQFEFAGQAIHFPAAPLSVAPNSTDGLVGKVFGH